MSAFKYLKPVPDAGVSWPTRKRSPAGKPGRPYPLVDVVPTNNAVQAVYKIASSFTCHPEIHPPGYCTVTSFPLARHVEAQG